MRNLRKFPFVIGLVIAALVAGAGALFLFGSSVFQEQKREAEEKQREGGLSWEALARPLAGTITGFAWSKAEPNVVYLGTDPNDLGVWKSEDFGETWSQVYHDDHTFALAVHPTEKGHLLIGDKTFAIVEDKGVSTARLVRSYDGGKTREVMMELPYPGKVNEIVFHENNPNVAAFVSNQDETPVRISRDGGKTFSGKAVKPTRDETYDHVRAIALDAKDPDIIYISVDVGQLMKSINGGDSWKKVLILYKENARLYSEDEWKQRHAINDIEAEANTVYLATSGGVYISKDAGNNWKYTGLGFANDIQIIGSSIYAATRDGIFKSNNEGAGWSRLSDFGADHVLVDRNNENRIVAAPSNWLIPHSYWWKNDAGSMQDAYEYDGVYYSRDGGGTWHQGRHFYHTDLVEISVNGDTMFSAAFCGRGAFISKDAGQSWQFLEIIDERATGGGNVMHYAMEIYADDEVIIMTGGDGSVISYDNGNSWELLPMESHSHAIFKDDDIILIGQSAWGTARPEVPGASIWMSADLGKTWNKSLGFPQNAQTEIHTFTQDGNGAIYASTHFWTDGTEGLGVYRSFDRGKTWEEFNEGFRDLDIHTIEFAFGRVYASTRDGLYLYMNDSHKWNKVSGKEFNDFAYDPASKILYGAEWSNLMMTRDGMRWERVETPWRRDTKTARLKIYGSKLYAATDKEGIFVAQLENTRK